MSFFFFLIFFRYFIKQFISRVQKKLTDFKLINICYLYCSVCNDYKIQIYKYKVLYIGLGQKNAIFRDAL